MHQRIAWLLLAAFVCADAAFACAPAPPPGERIGVVEESAIIVWEPATKTQHFIRRATFQGKPQNFGFLVPTPTAPTLAAVDDAVFDTFAQATARKTVFEKRKETDWTPLLFTLFLRSKGEATGAGAPVEVLSTQKVAGYDAAVLDATDANALKQWLETNGYPAAPDLVEWLQAYIAQGWKITAFKIDKGASEAARTSAVKMSFTTERPFFPYREPASQRENVDTWNSPARSLRVWFVGPERVDGIIGASAQWPHQLNWSAPIDEPLRAQIASASSLAIPANRTLTALTDSSNPRPGTDDLFFTRAADQTPFIPPPHVITTTETTYIPVDVVLLVLAVVGLLVWWFARRH